jgi:ribosomal protein S18 acetylase RimI-like enzyme
LYATVSRRQFKQEFHILADVTIRSAVEADAADIAAIHTASWRDAYAGILAAEFLNGDIETNRLELWSRRLIERPSSQLVDVACDPAGAMVAFACSFSDADPRWGSLVDNLHVLPRFRGQGAGEKLLQNMVARLAAKDSDSGLHLWVFEANVAALRFYHRLGGRVVETKTSEIPAAGGKAVLRVHWPALSQFVWTRRP